MVEKPWQLELVKRSLKKKEKLSLLNRYLTVKPGEIVLDLGCAQGILSYFLRQKGGKWISADQDFVNLLSSKSLLKSDLIQVGPGYLPLKGESLDRVISLDYLEHLEDDDLCLREIRRILKKEGQLLLAVPRTGRIFLLHRLKPLLGMKLEFYGHKREGYRLTDLTSKLKEANFEVLRIKYFSRFFSELLEMALNFFYIKFFAPKESFGLRDGHIRPTTAEEFSAKKKAFRMYSFLYPLIRLISLLDVLLFFQKGYGLMIWAKKKE
jgi:2-polyprenyl-3-methyl-5-hydroxy-6-metoxy-1,4-benzoquinol methylase